MTATMAMLVLVLPAAGALGLGLFGWRASRTLTKLVGPGVVWLAFVFTLYLFFTDAHEDHTYWTWIRSGSFELPANLLVDHLSTFMCLVITGVGALIVTYAVGYMSHEDDASYARFFTYMDLFIFSMLILVLAGNFVFLVIGWAMVGLSSYLLIGFYYWRPAAVLAARKAFVMNVIGDIGMILAAFGIFVTYHATTYGQVFGRLGKSDSSALEVIAFLLLVGAVAKSAQLPLHTWLPDAMEGPTPVSALIHAATMVTAGVYLVGRMHPIYDLAPYAHNTVAIIGAVTALFAATIGLVQTDIKRVLAYSTMSQIGYMFIAVGIGAYAIAFFHLMSHAFFKALLFMAAGNVIHGQEDEQDMRRYGGLWKDMPATAPAFLIGSLALVGIIPFVGFWSKESILGAAFNRGDSLGLIVWAVGFVTALLTGFYTGRMWWMSFWGERSARRAVEHPHEAPASMMIPVLVLALLSTIGGFLQISALGGWHKVTDYLQPVVGEPYWTEKGAIEYALTLLTMLLAGLLFLAAYRFYVTRTWAPWSARFPGAQRWLENRYYFDHLYDRALVQPMDWTAVNSDRWVDRPLIDGSVVGMGAITESGARGLSLTQTGYFRSYVLVFLVGVVIVGAIVVAKGLA